MPGRETNRDPLQPMLLAATSSGSVPSEPEILATFDRLVKDDVIQYDYSYATETRKINGIHFEFRISKALENKPATPLSVVLNGSTGENPRPGSDINTIGTEICKLGTAHFLAFNGFASYRPHYLLLTADGHRRQREPLDIEDFRAIHALLNMNGSDHLIFFNCGAEAGCSREHKHLQAIPKESFDGAPWCNLDQAEETLPFAYYERKLEEDLDPDVSLIIYREGLQQVERALNRKTTKEGGAPPHNMIMDRHRMVMIPRSKAGIDPLGANSGGMLGMIWTKNEETMQKWLEIGPQKILEAGGVPKSE
ncbi:hypothetical protein BGZ61DRAFT_452174 [Ilyonectria robusta]|uniref:uncharacterized protein n=1 Tax=Ilyonectria robusta TaxID=1079257 RepID=UPI001E8E25C3|nr:uncharacterized protein BGZ61DRAFT_452174 [Ilyonectria robusta]KAH8694606.1 hypothetical protein BGZ61DRAFT_452174 [Ilyonectria robusta]